MFWGSISAVSSISGYETPAQAVHTGHLQLNQNMNRDLLITGQILAGQLLSQDVIT